MCHVSIVTCNFGFCLGEPAYWAFWGRGRGKICSCGFCCWLKVTGNKWHVISDTWQGTCDKRFFCIGDFWYINFFDLLCATIILVKYPFLQLKIKFLNANLEMLLIVSNMFLKYPLFYFRLCPGPISHVTWDNSSKGLWKRLPFPLFQLLFKVDVLIKKHCDSFCDGSYIIGSGLFSLFIIISRPTGFARDCSTDTVVQWFIT